MILEVDVKEMVKRLDNLTKIRLGDRYRDPYDRCDQPGTFADYLTSVILTLRDYIDAHGVPYGYERGRGYIATIDIDSMEVISWERRRSESDTLVESATLLIALLSDDLFTVLDALTWSSHLLHLTGRNGTQLSYHQWKHSRYQERTGFMLVDHGKNYGISYDLINSLSVDSLEVIFSDVLNYI